jgi:retron-type reverse transcriptase
MERRFFASRVQLEYHSAAHRLAEAGISPKASLRKAFARVKANSNAAGVDHVTVEEFERHLEANLERLSQSLRDGTYRPQTIRRAWIPKLGSKEMRPMVWVLPPPLADPTFPV